MQALSVSSEIFVKELSDSEKKKYSNVKYLELPYIDWDDQDAETSIKNSQACKGGSDYSKDFLYVTKNSEQWNAKVRCFHMGGNYQDHLRKTTDRLAQDHCSQFSKDAFFRGDAKIKTQPFSRITKLAGDALMLGTTLNYVNITVAYVCDKSQRKGSIKRKQN